MSLGNSASTSAERLYNLARFLKERQSSATQIQHVFAEFLGVSIDDPLLWKAVPDVLALPGHVRVAVEEVSDDDLLVEWHVPIQAGFDHFRFMNQTVDVVGTKYNEGHLAHLQHAGRALRNAEHGRYVEPSPDEIIGLLDAVDELHTVAQRATTLDPDFKLLLLQVSHDLNQLLFLQNLYGPDAVRKAMYTFVGRWYLDFQFHVPTTTGQPTEDSERVDTGLQKLIIRVKPWARMFEKVLELTKKGTEVYNELKPGS